MHQRQLFTRTRVSRTPATNPFPLRDAPGNPARAALAPLAVAVNWLAPLLLLGCFGWLFWWYAGGAITAVGAACLGWLTEIALYVGAFQANKP